MKQATCAVVALTLAAASGLAHADADAPPNYVGVMGHYILTDSARDTDAGLGWQLLYGSPMGPHLSLELSVFGQRAALEAVDEYDYALGGGLDFRYLWGAPRLGAFLIGGLGSIWENFVNEEELSPFVNLGLGLQIGSDALQLRAESRYYAIFNGDTYPGKSVLYDARLGLGLMYAFGAAVDAGYDSDSDADGVPDQHDACARTPAGVGVDGSGCPLELDADYDGVADTLDACPLTVAGTLVDARGCPAAIPELPTDRAANDTITAAALYADADGDGIPDAEDACAQTPADASVDGRGCVVAPAAPTGFEAIPFEAGSSKLHRAARIRLDDVAAALKTHPDLRVEIIGYADAEAADNAHLAWRRAASVRQFLVDLGVDAQRLIQRSAQASAGPAAPGQVQLRPLSAAR